MKTSTYVKDSDQLLDELKTIPTCQEHQVITFDVVSLYTSIPITEALRVIQRVVAQDPKAYAIMYGLEVVLKSNYIEFGDTIWHQMNGAAMGTAVVPVFASIYLAYFKHM